jgi:uncharacterized membrane protein YwaF
VLAQVFGEKHIIGSGLLLFLVAVGLYFLPSAGNKKNVRRWLIGFTLGFLLLELLRLYFLLQRDGTWAIYQLPLNLCSVPLYLYPVLSWGPKQAWVKTWLMPPAFATVMLAGLIALMIPTNILGNELGWLPLEKNIVEIISFTFHALMIAAPLALIKLGFYKPKISDIPYALIFTFGFAMVAMVVNHFTNQDFLLLNHGNGSPFQFLISNSKLLYQITMISLGALLISLFFIIGDILPRWLTKINLKTTK